MIKTPSSHRLALLVLILIGFAILSYVSLVVFRDHPFCMDEYNYLYQAKIFSSGHLYLHADPKLSDLFETYMIFSNGKFFSKYPPGFSLLLLLGVKLGIPGLINPLLSVITMLLIYLLGAELIGSAFSLLALFMIVSNVYFLGYGASYFAQPASLFFSSLALLFYQYYRITKRTNLLCVVALAISFQTLVRPLDALCLWMALCFDLGARKIGKTLKPLLMFCVLSVVGTMLLLIYNKMTAGKWEVTPYPIWHSDFKLVYAKEGESITIFGQLAVFLKAYLVNLKKVFWPLLVKYFVPYLICWVPLIVLSFFGKRQEGADFRGFRRILLIYSLLLIALYNVHPTEILGWPQYGVRYWYPLIVVLGLLLAEGFRVLYTISWRQFFWVIFGLCILWQSYQTVHNLNLYSERFRFIQSIQSDINMRCPPRSIVILHEPKQWREMISSFVWWEDLQRNPFLSGPRLYVFTDRNLQAIQSLYQDYSVCDYYFLDHYPPFPCK